jgi:cellulose synthase/poly-beta-1,6-N-acetylglucosamine synthase-like glycosyltransferase
MTSVLSVSILATYYLVLGILALYGVHRLVLLALYYWNRGGAPEAPPDPAVWPRVTVQLPIFNEVYVAERLIEAVCALDYSRSRSWTTPPTTRSAKQPPSSIVGSERASTSTTYGGRIEWASKQAPSPSAWSPPRVN